ncbi:Dehydrogenase [Lachnellula subtilissima]|uniref:Dehydrogenase n=1 Tax=Lachnellula subtilissima TaxID=602034 RepID=A0A8H8RLM2_9HELO|nr:Dehydrogenase [Lachnellula subtilissima]
MISAKTQNALFVTELGKPVTAGIREIPTPGEDEVLIKVTATQLLPHDTYGRDMGLFFADHLPYVLGSNIAGTVQSPNPAYSLGTHIYGPGNPLSPVPNYSGLQEYALLTVSNSAPVPEGIRDEGAATLPINAVTTFAALFHPNHLALPPPWSQEAVSFDYSKETLVVIGAGSNCGRLALQFAKSVGIATIVAIASISNAKELEELGASHVIDRYLSQEEIVERVWGIVGAEGVIKVLDCVSWTYELAVALVLKDKKSWVATLHQATTVADILEKEGKVKAVVKFVMGAVNSWGKEDSAAFWKWLGKVVGDGTVRLPKYRVIEGLDAEKINEALDSYQDGSAVLQAVVRPGGKA